MMRFPDFVRVEFEEEVPYDVHVKLYIDYPSYLKDESFSFASHNLERKFKELLENYLGVDFGNPVHGKVNLTLSTISENVSPDLTIYVTSFVIDDIFNIILSKISASLFRPTLSSLFAIFIKSLIIKSPIFYIFIISK